MSRGARWHGVDKQHGTLACVALLPGRRDVTALSNGNYVVASPSCNNGGANARYGAATWGNGSGGTVGAVSTSNSLVGTTVNDAVGGSVTALKVNGNYVVARSPDAATSMRERSCQVPTRRADKLLSPLRTDEPAIFSGTIKTCSSQAGGFHE